MGTRFELVLLSGACDLRAAGEAALDEIQLWHARLTRFAPDSLVSHINRTAGAAPVRLDRDTFVLFEDAMGVSAESEGAFDITVAPVMGRLGFAGSAVPALGRRVNGRALLLDANAWTLRFSTADVSLDLGAIGKGHALDCAAAVLREYGVDAALLHGGTSSIAAIGAPPRSSGWRVAAGPEADAAVVTLRDAAMSVSDSASQRTPAAGGHIVDARTGGVIERARRAVVVGPSARLADAWATALVVLGSIPGGFPAGYTASISASGDRPETQGSSSVR
jgi:thiamine biosynthesis lipoprotein